MSRIIPFLWYDGTAGQAMEFYVSIFPNSRIVSVSRAPDGTVFSGTFELDGQRFMALNGGPQYSFSPAVSFFVPCESQAEVDALWEKLLAGGGEPGRCGWLRDRFGVSWQIIPSALGRLLGDPDRARAGRVMEAMLRMGKIDVAGLEQAYHQA